MCVQFVHGEVEDLPWVVEHAGGSHPSAGVGVDRPHRTDQPRPGESHVLASLDRRPDPAQHAPQLAAITPGQPVHDVALELGAPIAVAILQIDRRQVIVGNEVAQRDRQKGGIVL